MLSEYKQQKSEETSKSYTDTNPDSVMFHNTISFILLSFSRSQTQELQNYINHLT